MHNRDTINDRNKTECRRIKERGQIGLSIKPKNIYINNNLKNFKTKINIKIH